MKRFKRNLAVLLAAIMVVSSVSTAFAFDTIDLDDELFGTNVHSAAMSSEDEKDLFDEAEELPVEEEHVLRLDFDPDNDFDYSQNTSYLEIIMEAARVTKLNPFIIASMILQEHGAQIDEDNDPMVTGAGIDGKYTGIYNIANYVENPDSNLSMKENFLLWASKSGAKGRPWNSPERSIFRGYAVFSANYRYNGQENLYFKKFNTNPKSWTYKAHWATASVTVGKGKHAHNITKYRMAHQYMTNVSGAFAEAVKLGNAYAANDLLDEELTFYIPVYKGMPKNPCPKPETPDLDETIPMDLESQGFDSAVPNVVAEDENGKTDSEAIISEEDAVSEEIVLEEMAVLEEDADKLSEIDEIENQIKKDFKDYPDYRIALLNLHKEHPTWKFIKIEVPKKYNGVGTTWKDIIEGQIQPGCNVIRGTNGPEWKKNPDDTGYWVEASKKAVEYYMDPRNFLKDDSSVFMFLHMEYDCNAEKDAYMNETNVANMIDGTFLAGPIYRYSENSDPEEDDPEPQPEPEHRTYSSESSNTIPKGAVTGTWTQTDSGKWTFASKEGKTYHNEWAYIYNPYARGNQPKASWFFFDANGIMLTGYQWIPSLAGGYRLFYFHEAVDGTQGRMYENEATPDGNRADGTGWINAGGVTLIK